MRNFLFTCLYLVSLNGYAFDYSNDAVVVFHNSVCIKPHMGYHYQTCHPITVSINNFTIIIPKGFDTDLASIPRWLWVIIAPTRSDFIAPSILHDYLYTCNQGLRRRSIDTIFLSALLSAGVSTFTAHEMYWAVREFGGNHFDENSKCSWQDVKIDQIIKDFKTTSEDE